MKKDKATHKQMLDTFTEQVILNFDHHCKMHNIPNNLDRFATYLYDQGLISPSSIKQYTILATFEDLYKQNEGRKTQTVNLLANRFNLTPRSIWNVLRKRRKH